MPRTGRRASESRAVVAGSARRHLGQDPEESPVPAPIGCFPSARNSRTCTPLASSRLLARPGRATLELAPLGRASLELARPGGASNSAREQVPWPARLRRSAAGSVHNDDGDAFPSTDRTRALAGRASPRWTAPMPYRPRSWPTFAAEVLSARDSLQLADEVGLALRADRQRLGLSQRAYAARRSWTLATVIRLESAAGALKLGDVVAALEGTPFQLCLCHRPPTDDPGPAAPAAPDQPAAADGEPAPDPAPAPASPTSAPSTTPARPLPPPSRPPRTRCTRPTGRAPSSSPGCAVAAAASPHTTSPSRSVRRRRGGGTPSRPARAASHPTGTPRSTPVADPRPRDPRALRVRCRRGPAR